MAPNSGTDSLPMNTSIFVATGMNTISQTLDMICPMDTMVPEPLPNQLPIYIFMTAGVARPTSIPQKRAMA